MTVHTDYLWFNTKKRQEFIRITDEVAGDRRARAACRKAWCWCRRCTSPSGVYVNDWEDGLIHDFQVWLEKLAPAGLDYRHHQTGEDNADAHLKRTLMGHQVMLPITGGQARSRPVGAGVLRRVRRPAEEARRRQGDGRVGACSETRYPERPIVGVGAVIVDGGRVLLVKRGARAAQGRVEPAGRRRRSGRDARRRASRARCARKPASTSRSVRSSRSSTAIHRDADGRVRVSLRDRRLPVHRQPAAPWPTAPMRLMPAG